MKIQKTLKTLVLALVASSVAVMGFSTDAVAKTCSKGSHAVKVEKTITKKGHVYHRYVVKCVAIK